MSKNLGSFLGGLGMALFRNRYPLGKSSEPANGKTVKKIGDQSETSAPPKSVAYEPAATTPSSAPASAPDQAPVATASPVASDGIVTSDIAAAPQVELPATFTTDDWMNTPERGVGDNPAWDQLPA